MLDDLSLSLDDDAAVVVSLSVVNCLFVGWLIFLLFAPGAQHYFHRVLPRYFSCFQLQDGDCWNVGIVVVTA